MLVDLCLNLVGTATYGKVIAIALPTSLSGRPINTLAQSNEAHNTHAPTIVVKKGKIDEAGYADFLK